MLFALGIAVISFAVRSVVQSQLNKEIVYFKRYFEEKKDVIDLFNPLAIKQIPEEVIDQLYKTALQDSSKKNPKNQIDWSKYAYVTYATHANYICNSLIIFDALKSYGTKAKLVLLVSQDLVEPEKYDDFEIVNSLLRRLTEVGGDQVIIKFMKINKKSSDDTQWSYSLNKLEVFNQTEFDRVIYMDNDAILHDNLDELFFLPDYIKFAAPLAYWDLKEHDITASYNEVRNYEKLPINLERYNDKIIPRIKKHKMIYNHLPSLPPNLFLDTQNVAQDIIRSEFSFSSMFDHHITKQPNKINFASNLMVIKPSQETFKLLRDYLIPAYLKKEEGYDMDLINNDLYNMKKLIRKQFNYFRRIRTHFVPEVLVLPFGRYDVLTGSIKNRHEQSMLKNDVIGYRRVNSEGEELPKSVDEVIQDAKYIHFSDFPLQKPWEYESFEEIECHADELKDNTIEEPEKTCTAWNSAYLTYMYSRNICWIGE